MADPLAMAMKVSSSGLQAQTTRMQIITQNVANASVTGTSAESNPYTRKTISFSEMIDRSSGVSSVQVSDIGLDRSPFPIKYDPYHKAADENGMVKLSNVNALLEMADMRETVRAYEANLQTAKQAKSLITMTLDMMRS